VQLHMVAEPYISLIKLLKITNTTSKALRGTNGMRLEQQLMGHVRGVANLGLLFLDLYAGNVLVRPSINTSSHRQWDISAEAWDSRLTEFDRRMILPVLPSSGVERQLPAAVDARPPLPHDRMLTLVTGCLLARNRAVGSPAVSAGRALVRGCVGDSSRGSPLKVKREQSGAFAVQQREWWPGMWPGHRRV